jgi:hypothetical protein
MAERSKAHAWKVCIRQRIEGSNPSLSANYRFIKIQTDSGMMRLGTNRILPRSNFNLSVFLLIEIRPELYTIAAYIRNPA